jgi:hypothetical protein
MTSGGDLTMRIRHPRWIAWACAAALVLAAGCDSKTPITQPLAPTPTPPAPTPPVQHGTHTLSGTVRETGSDAPLPGVLVTATTGGFSSQPKQIISQVTNDDGTFQFMTLPYDFVDVVLTRSDLEPAGLTYGLTDNDVTANVLMQQAIVVTAGERVDAMLFSDDLPFYTGVLLGGEGAQPTCGPPCKLIRVSAPGEGVLSVRAQWSDATVPLTLYVRPYYTILDLPGNSPDAIRVTGVSPLSLNVPVYIGDWAVLIGTSTPPAGPVTLHIDTAFSNANQ